MPELTSLSFACPWLWLIWPIPLCLWFFYSPLKASASHALRVPFFKTIQQYTHIRATRWSAKKYWLIWLAWTLLLIGLSGPRQVGERLPFAHKGHNIMMILDISGSMSLPDQVINTRQTDRLTIVKTAAKQFIRHRIEDQLGLILFGSRAYLWTPLTYDRASVISRIDDATVGLAGQETAIGDATGLAIKHLKNTPEKGRVIILLTDGVNNTGVMPPIKAAEFAKKNHIKINTIGLGADEHRSGFSGLFLQANTASDLDEATLKKMAHMTGGAYFRATDLSSLKTIYQQIDRMERVEQKPQHVIPKKEWYPWFLMPAFLLLFYLLVHPCQWRRLL